MIFRRAAAFFTLLLMAVSSVLCFPALSIDAPHAEKNSSGHAPLSLAGPAEDRLYFLPVHGDTVTFEPVRRFALIPLQTVSASEDMPLCFIADGMFQAPHADLFSSESISPRAP